MQKKTITDKVQLPRLYLAWLTPRQLNKLAGALVVSKVEKRGVISEEKNSPEFVYVLLSGVARITCRNRKGMRTLLMRVAHDGIPARDKPGRQPSGTANVVACEICCRKSRVEKEEPRMNVVKHVAAIALYGAARACSFMPKSRPTPPNAT